MVLECDKAIKNTFWFNIKYHKYELPLFYKRILNPLLIDQRIKIKWNYKRASY
jgi:hypothetical protein